MYEICTIAATFHLCNIYEISTDGLTCSCWANVDTATLGVGIAIRSMRAKAIVWPDRVDTFTEATNVFTWELALVDICNQSAAQVSNNLPHVNYRTIMQSLNAKENTTIGRSSFCSIHEAHYDKSKSCIEIATKIRHIWSSSTTRKIIQINLLNFLMNFPLQLLEKWLSIFYHCTGIKIVANN